MKCWIIVGAGGSGKSEIAVNLAILEGFKYIVDLDTVNPYFRTADVKTQLKDNHNIEVIASQFANSNVDIPALPPEINKVFDSNQDVIFDVGADDGALALGRYRPRFEQIGYEMILVINCNRPFTNDKQGILEQCKVIEHYSSLKITKFINNTNIIEKTTANTVKNGKNIIENAGFTIWKNASLEDYNLENPLILERKIKYGIN